MKNPKKFNLFRNVKSAPDVYVSYNLLLYINLLKNKLEFIEFVDNYTVYSYELKKWFLRELETLKRASTLAQAL